MKNLSMQVLSSFVIFLLGLSFFATSVLAVGYGEGRYGEGFYNEGEIPTSSDTSDSSKDSESSSISAPGCSAQAPGNKTPWLYGAIAQNGTSVLLYFTEADDPVDHYVLEYGTKSGEYPYGSTNIGGKGSRTYLVGSLQPNTTYYFRVRAGNDCATGGWSNEISTKTKSLVSFRQLGFVESELEPVVTLQQDQKTSIVDSCQTYTVQSGDSLWSIAARELGDGNLYQDLIEQNESAYPSLATSNNVSVGWDLVFNCDADQTTISMEQVDEDEMRYVVNIRVTDTKENPVEGAKVTIHSEVQEGLTDANGLVRFEDVEAGKHRVIISYNDYEGEQSIHLTGDTKEFNLNITIEQKNVLTSPIVLTIIGGMGLVILALIVLLVRSRSIN